MKVERKVLTGSDMLMEFMSPWVAISWTVTIKLYRFELIGKHRFPELQVWDDYIFNRAILFENPDVKVLTLPDVSYYYFMRDDSIMHSAVSVKQMKSFDAVIDSTPKAVLNKREFLLWHEYFTFDLALGYCLSITKYGVGREEYDKYNGYLKNNIGEIIVNPHIKIKRKIAMISCGISPNMFLFFRNKKG